MKAIQITAPRTLQQIEAAEATAPGPLEALVRTHSVGICGTDVSAYLGKFPFFEYPRIPGHELGVEVLQVGSEVTHLQPGDRCGVEPYMTCGKCFACRQGKGNCCEKLSVIGVMQDGGLCDRFVIRADKLHVANALSYDQLALMETLAIGAHAVERCEVRVGESVLIIGVGPIGLAALEFAKIAGASITVMDCVASRLDFCAQAYGVGRTIQFETPEQALGEMREITGGDLFPLVIDATGNKDSMSGALDYAAHAGRVVFLGLCSDEIVFPQPKMHRRELTLLASRNALPADFCRIITLIEEGVIDTNPWITHRTKFDNVASDFELYTRPESGVVKAIIEVCG